jgi:phosphoribosylamine---glycine ligase
VKVLVVGGGAREHALAWKFRRDDPSLELIAAPGNPGIAELARCVPIKATNVDALVALAESERVGLTIVGPEDPLELGIVDQFEARGLPIFGPTAAAARIETSKRFAKQLMVQAGVPTAAASWHTDVASAKRAARDLGAPVVIKASGLAAGKGVAVCMTLDEADQAIESRLLHGVFGAAGSEVLVEEYMEGEELSVFAIADGNEFRTMLPAQDHKRLLEADEGPNTGGMGAYAPVSLADPWLIGHVADRIIAPTLSALREHASPFRGLLYAGLMLTADGPKVVEFNCRFGDPETEAILPLMRSSLLDACLSVATGGTLAGAPELEFDDAAAVTTVLAARGYPDAPTRGDPIVLPNPETGVYVFHAGTASNPSRALITAGGRVLAVTALAETLGEAREHSAKFAQRVEFRGKQFRSDIAWRELSRRARAS